jgi:hypothetical protein
VSEVVEPAPENEAEVLEKPEEEDTEEEGYTFNKEERNPSSNSTQSKRMRDWEQNMFDTDFLNPADESNDDLDDIEEENKSKEEEDSPEREEASDSHLKDIKKRIDKYYEESMWLFERKKEKERRAWDMKFQNYWSNLVSVEDDFNQTQIYSERLLDHVGKFRE